jgi:hypothetical protein
LKYVDVERRCLLFKRRKTAKLLNKMFKEASDKKETYEILLSFLVHLLPLLCEEDNIQVEPCSFVQGAALLLTNTRVELRKRQGGQPSIASLHQRLH